MVLNILSVPLTETVCGGNLRRISHASSHLSSKAHSLAALRLEGVAANDQRAVDPDVHAVVAMLLVDEDALCGLETGCDGEVGVVEPEVVEFVRCEGCPEGGGGLGGEWLELEWRHWSVQREMVHRGEVNSGGGSPPRPRPS